MKLHIDVIIDIEDCRLCPMCHCLCPPYYNSYECAITGKVLITNVDDKYSIPVDCPFKTNK